jgi:DNA-binding MltR family transcriptional regulator
MLRELQEFLKESDRGCILLLASRLATLLERLHITHVTSVSSPPKPFLKRLFTTHAPLSTFAAKIQLAYAYGLISRDDFLDLERIRKLRNKAAHSDETFTFGNPQIKEEVRRIGTPERIEKALPRFNLGPGLERRIMESLMDHPDTTKFYLVLSSLYLHITLHDGVD